MESYLEKTALLNYDARTIEKEVDRHAWRDLDDFHKIKEIYHYVRDEIAFGYNEADDLPADRVLADGYGQCNTKAILLMALFRSVGIACRIHGFKIHKEVQKGNLHGLAYKRVPEEIIHSYVEVFYQEQWYALEGVILDQKYLRGLEKEKGENPQSLVGYGVSLKEFQKRTLDWNQNDTYIQKDSITKDLGIFTNPDEFFEKYNNTASPIKALLYKKVVRRKMNQRVAQIRQKG